jgi:4'-phosphopantetheinyl transferase
MTYGAASSVRGTDAASRISEPKLPRVRQQPGVTAPAVWSTTDLRSLDGLPLGTSEVVYALVDLDDDPSARDEAVLDDLERARSRRFVQLDDGRRFVAAHASMRVLLAHALNVPPEAIRYKRDGDGKPRLASYLGSLEFSLSHSGTVGLLAVTRDRAVGVDVEQLRDLPDALIIAQQHFASSEASALRSLPADTRTTVFFRYWTHKEAVIKATGEGLRRRLDSFELDMTDQMATLKRFDDLPGDRSRWSLRELSSPPGFVAAGAVATTPSAPPPRWRALERPAGHEERITIGGPSEMCRGTPPSSDRAR